MGLSFYILGIFNPNCNPIQATVAACELFWSFVIAILSFGSMYMCTGTPGTSASVSFNDIADVSAICFIPVDPHRVNNCY